MNIDEVVDLINNHFTYKKGWRFTAKRSLDGVGSNVIVRVNRRSPDTTPGNLGFVPIEGNFRFDPRDMDELTVKAYVTYFALLNDIHDGLETARFDGFAPFHPHRDDGINAISLMFDFRLVPEKGKGD